MWASLPVVWHAWAWHGWDAGLAHESSWSRILASFMQCLMPCVLVCVVGVWDLHVRVWGVFEHPGKT